MPSMAISPTSPSCRGPRPLVVGAAHEQVAGLQGHNAGHGGDELGDAVLHVAGAVVVADLPVHPVLDVEIVRVRDLVRGHDPGADGVEGIEALAEIARHPRPLAGDGADAGPAEPRRPRGHVDARKVAEDVVHGLGLRDPRRLLADDESQLCLVVEYAGLERWEDDGVIGADDGVRGLEEQAEGSSDAACHGLHVVPLAHECLAGPRYGRAKADLVQGDSLAALRRLLQLGLEEGEVADDVLQQKLRRAPLERPHDAANVHHSSVGNHAWTKVVVESQLHGPLLSSRAQNAEPMPAAAIMPRNGSDFPGGRREDCSEDGRSTPPRHSRERRPLHNHIIPAPPPPSFPRKRESRGRAAWGGATWPRPSPIFVGCGVGRQAHVTDSRGGGNPGWRGRAGQSGAERGRAGHPPHQPTRRRHPSTLPPCGRRASDPHRGRVYAGPRLGAGPGGLMRNARGSAVRVTPMMM